MTAERGTGETAWQRVSDWYGIPIRIHPGRGPRSESAWSYHLPLSKYSRLLYENGFVIERIEEWVSDKESRDKAAKMENRARREFPLFLALLARKE